VCVCVCVCVYPITVSFCSMNSYEKFYEVDCSLKGRNTTPAGTGNFSLHHRVHTGPGAHPASYPIGTMGSPLGVKRPSGNLTTQPPSNAKIKSVWSYTVTPPIHLHGVVLS
jgi:hypothetical protein